jgi:hypothetical protein
LTPAKLKDDLFKMLDDIDSLVARDVADSEEPSGLKNTMSYLFFIRGTEIFHGIIVQFKFGDVVPAKILLRSLAENFILLKASVRNEDFSDRHLKFAGNHKEQFLKKTMEHLANSGFQQDEGFFQKLKAETRQSHEGIGKGLEPVYQLFNDLNELPIYFQIFAPASLYVHGNRQSFIEYEREGGGVKPVADRDFSSAYRHTAFSAALLMYLSYEIFCEVLGKTKSVSSQITARMDSCAAAVAVPFKF